MRPSSSRRRPNGFSLVELLVVVFIIGLLASVAVLTLPSDGAALRASAERFAARAVSARDRAISGGRPVALVMASAGYYFEQRAGGGWQPLDGGGAAIESWGKGVAASVTAAGPAPGAAASDPAVAAEGTARQRLVFDPVGLASSEAEVRLGRGGRTITVRVARDGTVRLDDAG